MEDDVAQEPDTIARAPIAARSRPNRHLFEQRAFPATPSLSLLSTLIGAESDPAATPTSATETVFLKSRGIDYIYVDRIRPNELVVDAVPIAATGTATVLRIP